MTGKKFPAACNGHPNRRRIAMHSPADRNLLFGILALQLDFITREQMVAGMNAWVLAKDRTLADLLEEQKALAPARRKLLEPLVDEHIRQHNNDPQQSLAATGSTAELQATLSRIADPQLAASIPHLSRASTANRASPVTRPEVFATISTAATTTPAGMRFRILRPHAQGGLGKVSVACDEELHREVALKEIQPQYADDQSARARFVLEAEVTGGLEHPSIVPVYGLGSYPDGRPYYAMRFIRGDSLKEVVDRFHKIPADDKNAGKRTVELRQLLGRFIDVCQAIEYAHNRGVLHRDIKPGNIMLGDYGETLVVDWGLAKAQGSPEAPVSMGTERALLPSSGSSVDPTQMGAMVGTLHFMSPEQAEGRLDLLGPSADIYSLGATLYYVLTGKASIASTTLDEIIKEIRSGSFPPPSSVNRSVPKGLEAICLKAMAREPQQRYATAKDLASDIERWLADEPLSISHESALDRMARWARRHRTWVRAVLASTVAIIAVLIVAVILVDGQRQEADEQRRNAVTLAEKNGELAARETQLRKEAEWMSATSAVEKSLLRCEQVDVATGLLSLVNDLELVERIGAKDLELSIRAQIGQWSGGVQVLQTATAHDSNVRAIAISPDGKTLFAGTSNQATLTDTISGALRGENLPIGSLVRAALFAEDGKVLITGSESGLLQFWDATSTELLGKAVKFDGPISALDLSPDGQRLAVGSGKQIEIWDVTTRTKTDLEFEQPGDIADLDFSLTGPVLLASDWDGNVRIWNLEAIGKVKEGWKFDLGILAVAFSPDGKLAAIGGLNNSVQLWDVEAGKVTGLPLNHQGIITDTAFSADGKQLLTASADQTACIWDVKSCRRIGPPFRHPHAVNAVVFDPSGTAVWTACGDTGTRKWQIACGRSTPLPMKGNGNVIAASFNSENTAVRMLAGGQHLGTTVVPGVLRRWEVPGGSLLGNQLQENRWLEFGSFSPSGDYFATLADHETVQVWKTSSGESIGSAITMSGDVKSLAFSHDDTILLIGTDDGKLRRWRIATGEPVGELIQLTARISDAAFARDDNELFVAASWDSKIYFNRKTFGFIEHPGLVTAVDIRPDGRVFVSGAADGTLRLWDASTHRQIGEAMKHGGRATRVAFLPDGLILAASYFDGTTRLWDTRTYDEIGPPLMHSKGIMALDVSPNGNWLATGSADWTAKLWNIAPVSGTGAEVRRQCEVLTALRLAPDSTLEVLKLDEWQALRRAK